MNNFTLGMIQGLHPATLKHLNIGHPWITIDSYSAKFPHTHLLYWRDLANKKTILFIKDPYHPEVCARKLTVINPTDLANWERSTFETLTSYIRQSLKDAFQKRKKLALSILYQNKIQYR